MDIWLLSIFYQIVYLMMYRGYIFYLSNKYKRKCINYFRPVNRIIQLCYQVCFMYEIIGWLHNEIINHLHHFAYIILLYDIVDSIVIYWYRKSNSMRKIFYTFINCFIMYQFIYYHTIFSALMLSLEYLLFTIYYLMKITRFSDNTRKLIYVNTKQPLSVIIYTVSILSNSEKNNIFSIITIFFIHLEQNLSPIRISAS